MNGTLVVIQARYGSKRLPGKALYPLGGRPMLAFLLERLGGGPWQLCLATTQRPEDDALAAWGRALGVPVVRGEDEDVLARFVRCLDAFPADVVVRVTGDNPLTCPELVELAARAVSGGADYAALPLGCPTGLGADAFAAPVLRRLAREAAPGPQREHINLHILDNPAAFSVVVPAISPSCGRQDIRLTVDTPQDYEALVRFAAACPGGRVPLGLEDIVRLHG
jgi:spore coat polysaccharide biosynthesis protein SpsF